jgi:acyl carrier protein
MAPEETKIPVATAHPALTPAEVLAEVTTLLGAIVGEQYLLDLEITMETSFNDDLALESVDFVALSTALQERYGDQVDFVAFMAGLELDELTNLRVGQLVSHIVESLASAPVAPDHVFGGGS